ncbi:beta-glucosidase [Sarracenia purpurea var. burkii]
MGETQENPDTELPDGKRNREFSIIRSKDFNKKRDPSALVEARIQDPLSRMTVKEKIGQMTQIGRSIVTPSAIRDLSIGSILNGGGSAPFEKAPSSGWADMVGRRFLNRRRSRQWVLAKKSDLWFSTIFASQICKSPRICGDAAAVMIDVPTGEERWSDGGAVVAINGGAGLLVQRHS